jgi:hypothetical protein
MDFWDILILVGVAFLIWKAAKNMYGGNKDSRGATPAQRRRAVTENILPRYPGIDENGALFHTIAMQVELDMYGDNIAFTVATYQG